MHSRRRNTIHDLAALRLHRDGSRVLNSNGNLSSRRAKYATRDTQGNWIAQDAGGLGTVKQRRSASQPYDEQEDAPELDEEEPMERFQQAPRKDKGKGRARESGDEEEVAPTQKARKRMKFDEDLSYLDLGASHSSLHQPVPSRLRDGEELPSQSSLPAPSSDLLKCLHYFASTYFTAMGQLHGTARESRRQRQLHPTVESNGAESILSCSQKKASNVGNPRRHSSVAGDSGEGEAGADMQGENDDGTRKGAGVKKRRRRLRPMEKDVYKLFDGSALMALGMLLQEHVAETLSPQIPADWEREMQEAEREKRAEMKRSRKAEEMKGRRQLVKLHS